MAYTTILILQISSPFILLGLLLTWIYRLSKDVKLLTKRCKSCFEDSEAIWRSMREREADIYLKIETVEEHVENIEDHIEDIEDHIEHISNVIVDVPHDAEGMLRGNKTKPKTK